MPWSGIIFELRKAETLPGEEVLVTGSAPELGCWDVNGVLDRENYRASGSPLLHTDKFSYPRWSMSTPVWFEFPHEEPEAEDNSDSDSGGAAAVAAGTNWSKPGVGFLEISYKYVKVCCSNGERSYQWEDCPNRCARVACQPDAIWLVADATWAGQGPCHIRRINYVPRPRHVPSKLDMGIVPPAGLSARNLPSPQARESSKNEVMHLQEVLSHLGDMAEEPRTPRTRWQVNESAMSFVQNVKELKDFAFEIRKGWETHETWSLRGTTEEHQQSRVGDQSGNNRFQFLREVVVRMMGGASELPKKQGAGELKDNELRSLRDEVSQLTGAEAELRRSQEVVKRAEDEIWSLRDEVSRLTGAEAELRSSQDAQKMAEDENWSLRDEVSRLRDAEAELRSSQDAQKRAEDENRSLHDEVSRLRDAEAELKSSQDSQKRAENELRSLRDEVSQLRDELQRSQEARNKLCSRNNLLREQLAQAKIYLELNTEETLLKTMPPPKEMVEEICEQHASRALGILADKKSRQAKALEAVRRIPPEAQNELMKALEKRRKKLAAAGAA